MLFFCVKDFVAVVGVVLVIVDVEAVIGRVVAVEVSGLDGVESG